MKIVLGKYPSPKKTSAPSDSPMIYEAGPRSLKYQDPESFEDYVEENEGDEANAEGIGFQVALNVHREQQKQKKPGPRNGTPDELNWDSKVLSNTEDERLLALLRPTAKEITDVARLVTNATVKEQLMGLIWLDPLLDFSGLTRKQYGNQA